VSIIGKYFVFFLDVHSPPLNRLLCYVFKPVDQLLNETPRGNPASNFWENKI